MSADPQDQPVEHATVFRAAGGIVRQARRSNKDISADEVILAALQPLVLAATRQVTDFDCVRVGMGRQPWPDGVILVSSHANNISDPGGCEADHPPFLEPHIRRGMYQFLMGRHTGNYTNCDK